MSVRRIAAALMTACALFLSTGSPALAQPAAAAPPSMPDGYYADAYSPTIYQVADGFHAPVTSADWTAAGSPAPQATPTDYVKYPWSSSIYAVTYWPDGWQWDELTYAQWVRAGSPRARDAAWIDGSRVERYDTSSEIFLVDPDGGIHKMTYGEWVAAASPKPEQQTDQGYLKLSWSDDIFEMSDVTLGQGLPMTGAEWAAAGRPTPRVVPWIAGEQWQRIGSSSTIYYSGPGVFEPVTPAQWTAAGRPAPHVLGGSAGTSSTYTNSDGVTVKSPVTASSAPAGATAKCKDGTYSFSQHHSGTCSHHGGVSQWL